MHSAYMPVSRTTWWARHFHPVCQSSPSAETWKTLSPASNVAICPCTHCFAHPSSAALLDANQPGFPDHSKESDWSNRRLTKIDLLSWYSRRRKSRHQSSSALPLNTEWTETCTSDSDLAVEGAQISSKISATRRLQEHFLEMLHGAQTFSDGMRTSISRDNVTLKALEETLTKQFETLEQEMHNEAEDNSQAYQPSDIDYESISACTVHSSI